MIGDSGGCQGDSIWPVLQGARARLLGVFLRTLAGGDGIFITVKFKAMIARRSLSFQRLSNMVFVSFLSQSFRMNGLSSCVLFVFFHIFSPFAN